MTIGAPTFFPAGPIAIRDGTVSRIQAIPGFIKVYPFRTLPTKDENLPAACVWHAGERTDPWGDDNVGAPSFNHALTLAVDIVTAAPSETSLDASVVPLVEAVRATLLTDPTWVNLSEGVRRCDVRYSYPKETDTFLAVGTIEFEVTFRSTWEPYLPNTLTNVAANATNLPGSPQILDITFED